MKNKKYLVWIFIVIVFLGAFGLLGVLMFRGPLKDDDRLPASIISTIKHKITYYDTSDHQIKKEIVYGETAISWVYASTVGRFIAPYLAAPWVSAGMGLFHNSRWSRYNVAPFVQTYNIDLSEFLPEKGRKENDLFPYSTFNNFFIRQFKEGKRPFPLAPSQQELFPAPAEGRLLVAKADSKIKVKGQLLDLENLLGREHAQWIQAFATGTVLIFRLNPTDYHRFHFPDDGEYIDYYTLGGKLHSVNPWALAEKDDIWQSNYRQVSILQTKNFGRMAMIEVGAMMVGRIVQHHPQRGRKFKRGEEKGYFLFGGSTVIVIVKKDHFQVVNDIEYHSRQDRESKVKLGQVINQAP